MTAQYNYERQRQRVKKTYPSRWAIIAGAVAVVATAVVWAVLR